MDLFDYARSRIDELKPPANCDAADIAEYTHKRNFLHAMIDHAPIERGKAHIARSIIDTRDADGLEDLERQFWTRIVTSLVRFQVTRCAAL
jgi:hypothetical protein